MRWPEQRTDGISVSDGDSIELVVQVAASPVRAVNRLEHEVVIREGVCRAVARRRARGAREQNRRQREVRGTECSDQKSD